MRCWPRLPDPCRTSRQGSQSTSCLAWKLFPQRCWTFYSLLLYHLRQLRDPNVAKTQIRGRIVPLQADRSLLQPAALTGIVLERPIVGPVGHLNAVDPDRHVPAVGDDCHREPLLVL